MKRKILYITGTRADYGLMQSVLRKIEEHPKLELELIVTGMHIMPEFGMTINEIKKDGFKIHEIDVTYGKDNKESMANFVGKFIQLLTEKVNEVKPDIEEILEKPQDPDKFESTYTTKVTTAISSNNFVSIDKLQDDKIKNIEENSNVTIKPEVGTEMNGNHIYYYMKERTFMTAQSYLCTQCPNTHLSHATAFVIHEDGILLTNYHVIDKKEEMNSSA